MTAPDPAAVDALIRRYRAETIDQGLLFPDVYRAYLAYRERADDTASLVLLRTRRLGAVLGHAVRQVPRYRSLHPLPADPWQALAGFPLCGRGQLRATLTDHCDDDIDPDRCRAVTTSGTSGEPVRVIHDSDHLIHTYALAMRRNDRLGLPFERRVLHPFHTALDRWVEYISPAQGFARVAQFGSTGDASYWREVVRRVGDFEPHAVVGHPTNILQLVDLLGEPYAGPPPAAVLTWGERLTPGMTQRLSRYFGAPVHDAYGLREISTVAVQCRAGQYHVESERLIVEAVDDEGRAVPAGTAGELVVTNLVNRAMPLIRYRTGDVGAVGDERAGCVCGAPQQVLTLLEGREAGAIRTPDGRRVPTMVLFRLLSAAPVERFQVVQRAVDDVALVVRPLGDFTEQTAQTLRDRAQEVLGRGVRVTVAADGRFLDRGTRKAVDFVSLLDS